MAKTKIVLPPDASEQLRAAGWSVDESTHPWVKAWCWRGPDGMPGAYRLVDAYQTMLWMRRQKRGK